MRGAPGARLERAQRVFELRRPAASVAARRWWSSAAPFRVLASATGWMTAHSEGSTSANSQSVDSSAAGSAGTIPRRMSCSNFKMALS